MDVLYINALVHGRTVKTKTGLPLLIDKIQVCYWCSKAEYDDICELLTSTPCVVKLSDDEKCYGEIIMSVADSNYATVCVVDYDKMENVPKSRVRMIKYL